MRIRLCFFVLLYALCAIGTAAQTALLPDQVASWQAEGPAKTLTVGDLTKNGISWTTDARVLKESGLSRIEQRTYRHDTAEATLRLFALKDPSSAYEFYTSLLAPGMHGLALGDDAAQSDSDSRILVGNLVIQATLSPNAKPQSLADLLTALKATADPTPFPPLRSYLPTRWRVYGSEKYTLGPEGFRSAMLSLDQGANQDIVKEVGFQTGAEAMLARYQGEKGGGVLLLIEYPTPQLAENHLHHLEQALSSEAKAAGVTVERKASMLSLVFETKSPMHAQAIRDEVNYETEVTWNEPSTTATDPPIVLVMFKIFLFTSLFLVIATIAGVFFGGVRILIKHWLPGKVFDRPQDIEVLQLGLSGKKIDPTDMY
jgi:uncharacterized protein DUF6599